MHLNPSEHQALYEACVKYENARHRVSLATEPFTDARGIAMAKLNSAAGQLVATVAAIEENHSRVSRETSEDIDAENTPPF